MATINSGTIFSQDSGYAPFDTFFHEFNLRAQPVYNFWTEDESTNDNEDRGVRDLSDIPRYIQLSWDVSPDIKDKNASAKSALGADISSGKKLIVNGVVFSPAALQDENFKMIVNSLANGYLAAGVVETVVEMHTGSIEQNTQKQMSNLVDEDMYLSKQSLCGIPFSEFNNVLWNRYSNAYGAQNTLFASDNMTENTKYFVSGGYGIINPTEVGGVMRIRSTDGNIGFSANVCTSKRTYGTNRIDEILTTLRPGQYDYNDENWDYNRVKVKFVDTRLVGAVSEKRVNSIQQMHNAEAMVAVAQNLGNLVSYDASGLQHKTRDVNIPTFNAPAGVKAVEYIGYVIEKYVYDGKSFVLKDTIYISDRKTFDYIDTKIKYGIAYRYRIKGIIRWTRSRGVGVLGKDDTTIDANITSINTFAPNQSSYFGSEWSKNWATAITLDTQAPNPPDELMVRPFSREKKVLVSFRLPYNPQRDINKMTLWRRLQDSTGKSLTNWEQLKEYGGTKRQGTMTTFSAEYSHDPKDITGTKFKTKETNQADDFVEYAPLNAQYIDTDVKYIQDAGYSYVYAALCHSSHGETSVLSDQLSVRLNKEWAQTGEFDVHFISCAGVNKDFDTGLFATYPEHKIRSEVIVKPNSLSTSPASFNVTGQQRTSTGLIEGNNYTLRIESLDNGQVVEVPITLSYNNMSPLKVSVESNVLIPNTDY